MSCVVDPRTGLTTDASPRMTSSFVMGRLRPANREALRAKAPGWMRAGAGSDRGRTLPALTTSPWFGSCCGLLAILPSGRRQRLEGRRSIRARLVSTDPVGRSPVVAPDHVHRRPKTVVGVEVSDPARASPRPPGRDRPTSSGLSSCFSIRLEYRRLAMRTGSASCATAAGDSRFGNLADSATKSYARSATTTASVGGATIDPRPRIVLVSPTRLRKPSCRKRQGLVGTKVRTPVGTSLARDVTRCYLQPADP